MVRSRVAAVATCLSLGAGLGALLSACGSSDNGGAIQTPTTAAHGAGSTTTTAPGSASTLPGGN